MNTGRIPERLLPAVLCAVLALGAADLFMLRRHRIPVHSKALAEDIGLHADLDGEALLVQWNHRARMVVNADRAILHIQDGAEQKKLELTGPQLDRFGVRYWPETEHVSFRLVVYRGDQTSSDSADALLKGDAKPKVKGVRARIVIEKTRPSPFERISPEIVVTARRPQPVIPVTVSMTRTTQLGAEAHDNDSGFQRVLSKIPLLRRLGKHRTDDQNEQR